MILMSLKPKRLIGLEVRQGGVKKANYKSRVMKCVDLSKIEANINLVVQLEDEST